MSTFADEDFSSDTSDDDYVPSDGEPVSEEENSGEDEDALQNEDMEKDKEVKGKKRKKKKAATAPVRKGGIQLEGEEGQKEGEKDDYNKELAAAVMKEREEKKVEEEKKREDSLWADFLKDTGMKPKASKPAGSGLASLTSLVSKTESKPKEVKAQAPTPASSSKVTITKEYDFAGETVKVTKEVDADSVEARKAASSGPTAPPQPSSSQSSASKLAGLGKRPGSAGGLGSVLGKISKKPKLGTLEKSKLDWDSFKKNEGIEEELKIHNRGKQGYLERMDFLNRTDQKQYEIERDIRLGSGKR